MWLDAVDIVEVASIYDADKCLVLKDTVVLLPNTIVITLPKGEHSGDVVGPKSKESADVVLTIVDTNPETYVRPVVLLGNVEALVKNDGKY